MVLFIGCKDNCKNTNNQGIVNPNYMLSLKMRFSNSLQKAQDTLTFEFYDKDDPYKIQGGSLGFRKKNFSTKGKEFRIFPFRDETIYANVVKVRQTFVYKIYSKDSLWLEEEITFMGNPGNWIINKRCETGIPNEKIYGRDGDLFKEIIFSKKKKSGYKMKIDKGQYGVYVDYDFE